LNNPKSSVLAEAGEPAFDLKELKFMAFLQDPSPFRDAPRDLKTAVECLRPRWGWIVALGALIAGMGVAALILAGAAEIATSLSAKTWDRFLLWIIARLSYIVIVVAAFALARPLAGAAFLPWYRRVHTRTSLATPRGRSQGGNIAKG
jgi:uncharacterized membrane protein HdeD (DUF308 family)